MAYYKKYISYFLNKTFKGTRWGYVIFFVTNKCNSRCKHCFYWKELNSGEKELEIEEIDKITKKMGKIEVLLLSGGEPFLRKDLVKIIRLFIKNNGTRVISIPTNATLTGKIARDVSLLVKEFPDVTFSVNPSVDNLHAKNDEIRGIKGSFEKSLKTIRELEKIRRENKNLEIVVNTTISNSNYKDVDEIIAFFKKFDITYHNFELLRGEPFKKNIKLPKLNEIKKLHEKAIKLREYYIRKNSGGKKSIGLLLERIPVLGITRYTHHLKERVLNGRGLPFQCSAGKNIVVIEPEGDIRLCELQPRIGNLRDYDYNIEKVLRNKNAVKLFEGIKKCSCTHVCFINMSIANDKKSLAKIPYHFLKWKK